MKFEDQVKKVAETLNEAVPNVPQPAGNPMPAPVNGQQVAPQGQQQPVAGQQEEGPTADQILQFALNSDPKTLKTMGVDPTKEGDELFQAVHSAFLTNTQNQNGAPMNPAAASNPQNTSAQPASTNTSGMPGATSIQQG